MDVRNIRSEALRVYVIFFKMEAHPLKIKNGRQTPIEFTVNDYVDIVEKQRHQYDTFFALKSWRPKPFLHPETTKSIAEKILNSPRMKDTMFQVSVLNVITI